MRNFDENNITDAVLKRIADTEEPRARQVSEAMVRHLHNFIREVEPTFDEWQQGIQFLTDIGHMCDENRQEFILLSDTLGVSMLVDAINHRNPAGTTETTVLGPFYIENRPSLPLGADISDGAGGTPMLMQGTVCSPDGKPLAGATVDTWHSDNEGFYDVQHFAEGGEVSMRACFTTDDEGKFWFWSIVPKYYPIPTDGPVGKMLITQCRHAFRPAHIHFMIGDKGYETLVTHLFIAGDPYIDSDVVFGVKESLIKAPEHHSAGTAPDGREIDKDYAVLSYDFILSPATGSSS